MNRMTTLKLSLMSAFATLFLLLAMLASTGTASAHTASSLAAASFQPHIAALDNGYVYGYSGDCKSVTVFGTGFPPGLATLQAWIRPSTLTVSPGAVFVVDPYGKFLQVVIICDPNDFGDNFAMRFYPINLIARPLVGPPS